MSGDDWVLVCRNVEVAGEECWGREIWGLYVNDDKEVLGLQQGMGSVQG